MSGKGFPFKRKKYSTIIVLLIISAFFSSCSIFKPKFIENTAFQLWASETKTPPTIAILPFENATEEAGIEELVRKSFYSHFSVKNFNDIELSQVDTALRDETLLQNKKFQEISPTELGRFLKCDALIYGRVIEMTRFYIGIYSQLAVGAEIRIVETRTGKIVWQNTLTTRFHEGDLPLNPLSILPTTIKTGMNLRETQKLRVIDDLCRNLTSLIPDIPASQKLKAEDIEIFYELQVASYRSSETALKASQELQNAGYSTILRHWKNEKGEEWCRLIVGPFLSRNEALNCKNKIEQDSKFHPIILKIERPKTL